MILCCAECGALFTPHNPHQGDCDACELAYMKAETATTDRLEQEEHARAEFEAQAEWKEAA